ncbi:MAG: SRPBCC domain-containing protein [Proteobacteria bacterium]|nr:SRPBCC domain-containing protein [Pseudomonadota bacterium]
MNADHPVARAKIFIRQAPSIVFDVFVRPERMRAFWFDRRDDGLKQGETVQWYLGPGADAVGFDVRVKVVDRPQRLAVDWGDPNQFTAVTWTFEERGSGTLLTIEETGFQGTAQEISASVIDSTGGFNQVVVAAKAFVEHGAKVNIVDDHA